MFLTIEAILAADDRQIIEVSCPEWKGTVAMLPFSGDDRDWYDQLVNKKRWPVDDKGDDNPDAADWRGLRAAAVARAMCDGDRKQGLATESQVIALGEKSGAALNRCWEALREASGFGADADDDAEKNLKPAQSGGPGSNCSSEPASP